MACNSCHFDAFTQRRGAKKTLEGEKVKLGVKVCIHKDKCNCAQALEVTEYIQSAYRCHMLYLS